MAPRAGESAAKDLWEAVVRSVRYLLKRVFQASYSPMAMSPSKNWQCLLSPALRDVLILSPWG